MPRLSTVPVVDPVPLRNSIPEQIDDLPGYWIRDGIVNRESVSNLDRIILVKKMTPIAPMN